MPRYAFPPVEGAPMRTVQNDRPSFLMDYDARVAAAAKMSKMIYLYCGKLFTVQCGWSQMWMENCSLWCYPMGKI